MKLHNMEKYRPLKGVVAAMVPRQETKSFKKSRHKNSTPKNRPVLNFIFVLLYTIMNYDFKIRRLCYFLNLASQLMV
jgi:hypothetical protein